MPFSISQLELDMTDTSPAAEEACRGRMQKQVPGFEEGLRNCSIEVERRREQ